MAILKRTDADSSPGSASSQEDDDEPCSRSAKAESDASEASDADSRTQLDEFDPAELGEARAQLCQVGNHSCAIPLDLFELPELGSVLSLETWNECLSEEERFALAEYLPDMDEETFGRTLKELFSGQNFHFGSPLGTLFNQLKGGLCDPGIVLHRHVLTFLQRRDYYHGLCNYHNSMVRSLSQIKYAWQNCARYGVKERLRLLDILRSQRPLSYERNGNIGSEINLESRESDDLYLHKRFKMGQQIGMPSVDVTLHDMVKLGRKRSKGVLKVATSKVSVHENDGAYNRNPSALKHGYSETRLAMPLLDLPQQDKFERYNVTAAKRTRDHNSGDRVYMEEEYMGSQSWTARRRSTVAMSSLLKTGKKQELHKRYDVGMYGYEDSEGYSGFSHFKRKSMYADQKKPNKLMKVDRKGYSDFLDVSGSMHKPDIVSHSAERKHGRLMKKGLVPHPSDKLIYAEKHRGMIDVDRSPQHSFYFHDYGGGLMDEYMENLDEISMLRSSNYPPDRPGNIMEFSDVQTVDATHERSSMPLPLQGCHSASIKPKRKVGSHYPNEPDESLHLEPRPKEQIDDLNVVRKAKRKADAETNFLTAVTPDLVISEKGIGDVEPKAKPQKNSFTLITPTIHAGFSFSIIHLLSAVRKAMITPHMVEIRRSANHLEKDDWRSEQKTEEHNKMHQVANGTHLSHSLENMDKRTSEFAGQNNLLFFTVQEIVDRVRSNPGDPCILETQEPLQDLVRGVLKIFSSKTTPLGAKGWKPLILYEKSNKSWYWAGAAASFSSENDKLEEETSSEAWGIPHKMLVKLVDAFANWLKSGQETLQQIGSLPPPPTMMLSNLDEKERFKDLRAQKSLSTFSPSSDDVRAYFRREEFLRYSVPDRAFSYTAADGKKSIVAPLRRGAGKPTSKARDHFMLKPDRPPHVTILCLVRDAAARLPGSIGTRADVCTLLRDSQYIVDKVSDAQVNQVVSGALDRLHYEHDPCVQFDTERKLWVYLHKDREEEDFEDDGTSSTKKWKRQKKDSMDQSDTGTVNDVDTGLLTVGGFSTGLDHDYDLNVDTSSVRAGKQAEIVRRDMGPNMENIHSLMDSSIVRKSHSNWEGLGLNQSRENRLVC